MGGEDRNLHPPQDEGDLLDHKAGGHAEAGQEGGWTCGGIRLGAGFQVRGQQTVLEKSNQTLLEVIWLCLEIKL